MAQAEANRANTHAADPTRADSNMDRYHNRMQEHLNALRAPSSLSKGDLVYAHKPDAKRGKFAHTWRDPYMIVGCHSGNNNYTLQTLIDQKVQRTTCNINDYIHSLTRIVESWCVVACLLYRCDNVFRG
jgi:hypothetical protein